MSTAIIVEDEPLLRAELRDHLLDLWPDLDIVAETDNGVEALRLIDRLHPDFVFLDIQIPGIRGNDLAKHLSDDITIVFVTAFPDHALEAFEAGASDYILKPITRERLAVTIKRIQGKVKEHPIKPTKIIANPAPQIGYLKWIKASVGDTVRLILVDDVDYFSATDKYTRLVTKSGDAYIRLSLKHLIEQLDPEFYTQIHRGTLINLRSIDRIERNDGAMWIFLRGRPEKLQVSESYMKQFRQM